MQEEATLPPNYVVLGFGQSDYPEEFLVLVHESERQGIPFHWLTRDVPSSVEKLRKAGKKDHDIARILGYMVGGDCKFGFYLGLADEDVYFYLSGSFSFTFLEEYGPGSKREELVRNKPVRFLVCDQINIGNIETGEPTSYIISKKNADGKARPYERIGYLDDEFYEMYVQSQQKAQ